jgi:hypothetical protein
MKETQLALFLEPLLYELVSDEVSSVVFSYVSYMLKYANRDHSNHIKYKVAT